MDTKSISNVLSNIKYMSLEVALFFDNLITKHSTKEVLEIKYQYHDMFRNLPTTDKHDIELFNRLKNVKPLPKTPIVMRELPFIDDLA